MVPEGEGVVRPLAGMTWCTAFRRPYGTRFHHLAFPALKRRAIFEGPSGPDGSGVTNSYRLLLGFR